MKKKAKSQVGCLSFPPASLRPGLYPQPHSVRCHFLKGGCAVTSGPCHMPHEEAEAEVPWGPVDTPGASLGHPPLAWSGPLGAGAAARRFQKAGGA